MRVLVLLVIAVGCTGGPVLDPRPRPANARALCDRDAGARIAWMARSTARFDIFRDEHDAVVFEPVAPTAAASMREHLILDTADGRRLVLVDASLLEYEVRERLGANAAMQGGESVMFLVAPTGGTAHYVGVGELWTEGDDRFLVKGTRRDGARGLFDLPAGATELRRQGTQDQIVGRSNRTLVLASFERGWMTLACLGDPERTRSYRVPDGAWVGRDAVRDERLLFREAVSTGAPLSCGTSRARVFVIDLARRRTRFLGFIESQMWPMIISRIDCGGWVTVRWADSTAPRAHASSPLDLEDRYDPRPMLFTVDPATEAVRRQHAITSSSGD